MLPTPLKLRQFIIVVVVVVVVNGYKQLSYKPKRITGSFYSQSNMCAWSIKTVAALTVYTIHQHVCGQVSINLFSNKGPKGLLQVATKYRLTFTEYQCQYTHSCMYTPTHTYTCRMPYYARAFTKGCFPGTSVPSALETFATIALYKLTYTIPYHTIYSHTGTSMRVLRTVFGV